ncbi:hypothetical protein [Macrococcus brunensis]|uniref:hypothetical protein n=1 Tax=Macrococcus brunensis TaxID=198483 RepID=UPI001EEFD2FE|nr:hypothetical protein [Macrococcus brunensis]ULG73999.1 hypothetical protein MGG13_10175 [Macrococcus brunensis]
MNWALDVSVQRSQLNYRYGNYEKLYGKSTNLTVFHVLRDIYDPNNKIESSQDPYDIVNDVFEGKKYSDSEKENLANGLTYIAMRESKATTLEEYIKFMQH